MSPIFSHILFVGIDGLGGLYMENATDQYMPFLLGPSSNTKQSKNRTFKFSSFRMRNQFPTVSAPNWSTILTGQPPEMSGIVDNFWSCPDTNSSSTLNSESFDSEAIRRRQSYKVDINVPQTTTSPSPNCRPNSTIEGLWPVYPGWGHPPQTVFEMAKKIAKNDSYVTTALVSQYHWPYELIKHQEFPQDYQQFANTTSISNNSQTIIDYMDTSTNGYRRRRPNSPENTKDDDLNLGGIRSIVDETIGYIEKINLVGNNSNSKTLFFTHLDIVDEAGHHSYWGSPLYYEKVRACDKGVEMMWQRFVEKINGNALLIVTADHGGFQNHHGDVNLANVWTPLLMRSSSAKSGSLPHKINVNEDDSNLVGLTNIDIVPTVLSAMFGMDKTESVVPKHLRGRSVFGMIDALADGDSESERESSSIDLVV